MKTSKLKLKRTRICGEGFDYETGGFLTVIIGENRLRADDVIDAFAILRETATLAYGEPPNFALRARMRNLLKKVES